MGATIAQRWLALEDDDATAARACGGAWADAANDDEVHRSAGFGRAWRRHELHTDKNRLIRDSSWHCMVSSFTYTPKGCF